MKIQLLSLSILLFFTHVVTASFFRHDRAVALYEAFANEAQFNCTGSITVNINGKVSNGATCVLIQPRYVLTAAHIFSWPDSVTGKEKPANLADFTFYFKGQQLKAKKLIIYPDYLKGKDDYDIAIVELEARVKNIKPAAINTSLDELHTIATFVGFGGWGSAIIPERPNPPGTAKAGENMIDSIGGKLLNGIPVFMYADMDFPEHPEYNLSGDTTPLNLEAITTGGDSGGPVFRKRNDKWELIGLVKGSQYDIERFGRIGYYGQLFYALRLAPFTGWIKEHTHP